MLFRCYLGDILKSIDSISDTFCACFQGSVCFEITIHTSFLGSNQNIIFPAKLVHFKKMLMCLKLSPAHLAVLGVDRSKLNAKNI